MENTVKSLLLCFERMILQSEMRCKASQTDKVGVKEATSKKGEEELNCVVKLVSSSSSSLIG